MRDKNGLTEEEFLSSYDPGRYPRPSVTADALLFSVRAAGDRGELRLLMVKRAGHPFIGRWALPGGFVNIDEELEQAAKRELREETGAGEITLYPLGAFGGVNRDPRTRVITHAYFAALPGECPVLAGDDAAKAQWVTVECSFTLKGRDRLWDLRVLPDGGEEARAQVLEKRFADKALWRGELCAVASDLASDHAVIIVSAVKKLRELATEGAASLFLPDVFTLPRLKAVLSVLAPEDQGTEKGTFRFEPCGEQSGETVYRFEALE